MKEFVTLKEIQPVNTYSLEKQFLQDVMNNTGIVYEVMEIVNDEMFTAPEHTKIWRTIVDITNNGDVPTLDKVAVQAGVQLVADNALTGYYSGEQESISRAYMVRDAAARRRAYAAALALLQKCADGSLSESDVYTEVQALEDRVESNFEPRGEVSLATVFNRIYGEVEERLRLESEGRAPLVPTSFPMLDDQIEGGFDKGQLIVMAARPSVGKTALMLQMAKAAAESDFKTCIFSLEMTNEQLGKRYLYSTEKISAHTLRRGFRGEQAVVDAAAFDTAVAELDRLPILINESARSLKEIVTRITLNVKRGRCQIAFIDYLGYIENESDPRKNTVQKISEITARLKALAKTMRIPIVLLCQLNRESAKGVRPPQLYDLRDSGSIEQDADVVLMLERKETAVDGTLVNIWVRKNRQGQRDLYLTVKPNASYTKFTEKELVFNAPEQNT